MVPKQIARSWLPVLLAAGVFPADGATRVWTGAQNGLWSNPANWEGALIPGHLDSIEFPADAAVRDTVNDFLGRGFGSITFTGGGYTVGGHLLYLDGGIVSFPGGTTNHFACGIFVNKPQSFVCFSYFNELGFSGSIQVAHPLRLVTGSMIRFHGGVFCSNDADITMTSAGWVSFGPNGGMGGTLVVERGTLELAGQFPGQMNRDRFGGLLIVGDNGQSGGTARVLWRASNKLVDATAVVLTRSGILDLDGHSDTIGLLSGEGTVLPNAGRLTVSSPGGEGAFAGSVRGTGTLGLEGFDGGFVLSGHHSLTGLVQVAAHRATNFLQVVTETPCQLIFSGSASNAVIALADEAILTGNGVARSLIASNAVVRAGPGTLRLLESCALDGTSTIEFQLDGPEAGRIDTPLLDLAGAKLRISYHGHGLDDLFTLISAGLGKVGSAFDGLPEGARLVAGDPGAPSEFRLTYSGNDGHDVVLERTGLFVPPTLRIRLSGASRLIEWPLTAPGYSLQRAFALEPAVWTGDGLPVPDATATDFFVIDDAADEARFYRLFR